MLYSPTSFPVYRRDVERLTSDSIAVKFWVLAHEPDPVTILQNVVMLEAEQLDREDPRADRVSAVINDIIKAQEEYALS